MILSGAYMALARALLVIGLAMFLPPEIYGLFSSASALYLVLVVCVTAGVSTFIARSVAIRGLDQSTVVMGSLASVLLMSIVAALVFYVVASGDLFAGAFGYPFNFLAFAVVLRGLAVWAFSVFVASENSSLQFKFIFVFHTLELLMVFLALRAGYGVGAVIALHLAAWGMQAGFATWLALFLRSRVRFASFFPQLWRSFSVAGVWSLLSVNVPLAMTQLTQLLPLALTPFVMLRDPVLGSFALSWNLGMIVATIAIMAINGTIPVLAKAIRRVDENVNVFALIMFCSFFVAGIVGAMLGFIGFGAVVGSFFGEGYMMVAVFLPILLWVGMAVAAGYFADQLLILRELASISWVSNVLSLLFSISLFLYFASLDGLLAGAVAFSCSVLFFVGVRLFFLYKYGVANLGIRGMILFALFGAVPLFHGSVLAPTSETESALILLSLGVLVGALLLLPFRELNLAFQMVRQSR